MSPTALPKTCAATSALWASPATALYLGPSLRLAPHSTSVHCLVVGIDAPIRVTAGSHVITARSVLVPPRTVHQVTIADDSRILFCYNDVNTARGRGLTSRMAKWSGPLGTRHHDEAELVRLGAAPDPDGAPLLAAAFGATGVLDPRIRRTIERISAEVNGSAAELAGLEGLSTPYFLRLFGRETGTTFRRYRLWVRMLRAARLIASGADLTRAAVDSGFASPSHFSDAFLRMFGLTASDLLGAGATLVVADDPSGW